MAIKSTKHFTLPLCILYERPEQAFRCGQIEIRIEITECVIGHLAKDQNINHVSHVTLRTWIPIRQLAGKGYRCDLFTTFFGD